MKYRLTIDFRKRGIYVRIFSSYGQVVSFLSKHRIARKAERITFRPYSQ